ncbi:hypothetical protein ACTFIR_002876 [Dictyostelium discoideum]
MNNIEILWQYIGKYYSNISKWMSQTMTSYSKNGHADNVVTGTSFSLTLRLNYPFISGKTQRSASKDHSKLMYGTSDDGQQKIFCLGGLNWQRVQESRGGGAFCMKDIGYLVDYMKRHVSWTRKGILSDDIKIGVPHSTIGTEINFSWIKKQLEDKNLNVSMGFEILIPTTQNPLPKRFIEPAQSKYITKNAPLLVEPIQAPLGAEVEYKTEAISIDIFPSIKDKVHICPQSPQCLYKLSAKFNIISNIYLKVKPIQKNINSNPIMTITTNANSNIIISQELRNNYFSSLATQKILQLDGNNKMVYLQKTQQNLDNFKFEFSPSSISTPCTIASIDGKNNIISLMFHETCVDQLIFCLFNHFQIKSIDKTQVFNAIDQLSFHNDVTKILNDFFPDIQDISRCVEKPPPPGSVDDGKQIDKVMGSQASADDL